MVDMQKIRQKVFDQALAHLRKQGEKSMEGMGCSYRGDGGLECAIGIFISDRKYKAWFEGKLAADILHALPRSVSGAGEDFLVALQAELHDDLSEGGFPTELEAAAKRFAVRHHLHYSALVAA